MGSWKKLFRSRDVGGDIAAVAFAAGSSAEGDNSVVRSSGVTLVSIAAGFAGCITGH